MHGEMTADFTKMPIENMLVLFGGFAVLLVIAAIVIVAVVRRLGIRNFGPFKVEHDNTTVMYDMNDKIKDIDDMCHKQMRYVTDRMRIHISNIFVNINIGALARISIASVIRIPLFESISNNHFTTEFMPERYAAYRDRIIDSLKDEYVSLAAIKDENCTHNILPPWEQMSDQLIGCVDLWLKRISKEVMDACDKKIQTYKDYHHKFEETKDEFRLGVIKRCIEKNERYTRELKRLI